MKGKKITPRLDALIPDAVVRERVLERLYSKEGLFGEGSIFTEMLQSMVNAALEGELDQTLRSSSAQGLPNRRNGHTRKKVRSSTGVLDVRPPRDREGVHEPVLVKKWERDLHTGIDQVILSLYARGQSVEDIRMQLQQLYGLEVSAGTISAVTDRILPEITLWQSRPLSPCYAVVYLDAIHYKVRQDGKTTSKAFYTTYGIGVHGDRDILGLYLGESEGSRQWGLILEDLRSRGVEDVLFFCVDGLSGFKSVIEQVFPQSHVQRCIVHMVRASTRFINTCEARKVRSDLRLVYTSATREQAGVALASFKVKWDKKYREVSSGWEKNWDELMEFMDFPSYIRRLIYTTNPVEALHRVLRKVTKTKGAWSNDKGLIKQIYLTLKYNQKSWKKPVQNWLSVKRDLMVHFGYRYTRHLEY